MRSFYTSSNIVREGHGERRNAYRMLAGKPEGERLLGRPRRRWGDNNKIIYKKQGRDWIQLDQNSIPGAACVNTVINL